MSLAGKIEVNAHYTRSANLERDANSPAAVRSYIPTARAIQTLSRIADTLKANDGPRAWSLVGPYGAGKSSFAAFLTYLLAPPDTEQSHAALQVLKRAQADLANRFQSLKRGTGGHCVVLLTGSPEPLSRRLIQALADGAAAFWANRRGRKPDVIEALWQLADQERVQVSELLDAVAECYVVPSCRPS